MTRVLVIDNFDSFTNNIVQYLQEITGQRPLVVDNRARFEDLPLADIDAIILSPGPGRPGVVADFGVCREVLERHPKPILGVCLGHQGVAEVFGGSVVHAPEPVHGLVDDVTHDGRGLFAGLPNPLSVVRYHSLMVSALPAELEVTAVTSDGVVMGIRHRELPIWGVQFHPESIDTSHGHDLFRNFLELARPVAVRHPVATAFERAGGTLRGKVRVSEIDWPEDLAATFRQAHESGARFWLDADGSEHPDARYSVMGQASTDLTLSYRLGSRILTIRGPHGREDVHGDVFELIDQLLGAASLRLDDPPTPFTAGLVGYFGYELKALVNGSEPHVSSLPDAAFTWVSEFIVFDHEARRAWRHTVVPGGPREGCRPPRRDESASDADYAPGPVPEAGLSLRDSRDVYLEKIRAAKRLIRDGESYEICLTNVATEPVPADALASYERMRAVSPVPYGAFVALPGVTLLSSSPETFLRIDADGQVTTKPIKGTRPRDDDAEVDERLRQDLRTNRKDRAENLMIVDLVRHDLNTVCEAGSVRVPSPFQVQSFRSVHQLVSTVVGQRSVGLSAVDVVRACFPPGSMTGAPKIRTMEIIDVLEGSARGPYSGTLGWFDVNGAVRSSVLIRTVSVGDRSATFGIGGAITALSDPEDEFEETLVKASVPAFGLRTAASMPAGVVVSP
jgi:para-aminobenzoate synthetase